MKLIALCVILAYVYLVVAAPGLEVKKNSRT